MRTEQFPKLKTRRCWSIIRKAILIKCVPTSLSKGYLSCTLRPLIFCEEETNGNPCRNVYGIHYKVATNSSCACMHVHLLLSSGSRDLLHPWNQVCSREFLVGKGALSKHNRSKGCEGPRSWWVLSAAAMKSNELCKYAQAFSLRMSHNGEKLQPAAEATNTQNEAILSNPATAVHPNHWSHPANAKSHESYSMICSFKQLGSLCNKSKWLQIISTKHYNDTCKST